MEERISELEKEVRAVNRKLDTAISMFWQLIPIDKGIYDDMSRRMEKPLRKYKKKSKERTELGIEKREEVNHGNQGVIAQ